MTFRKKFAKALRTKIGSGILLTAMATPSTVGGIVAFDYLTDEMQQGTSKASVELRDDLLAQTNDIIRGHERLSMIKEGAENAATPELQEGFLDKYDLLKQQLSSQAHQVAVAGLTNPELTEADYALLEGRFDIVEKKFNYTSDDAKLNMPGNPNGLRECQLENEHQDDPYVMRDCMMDRQHLLLGRIGALVAAAGSLFVIFNAAGGTQAPQRLAQQLERAPANRRRKTKFGRN